MGLFDRMTKRMMDTAMSAAGSLTGMAGTEEITDGIIGVGTVAEVPVITSLASTYMQPLALVIELPGRQPYPARPMAAFTHDKIPTKGQRLPVKVSASDPAKIAVLWDQVKTGLDEAVAQATAQSTVQSTAGSGDVLEELAKLGALRDSGTISEAEFATLKARLIGR